MRFVLPSRSSLMWLAVCLGALATTWAVANPVAPSSNPTPTPKWGWTEGQVAAQTATALSPQPPVTVNIPAELAQLITETTALFYFSPTCPHCIEAMKEVGPLAKEGSMPWIGISVGGAAPTDIQQFMDDFNDPFLLWKDEDHGFGMAVGARSTPNVYIAHPFDPQSDPDHSATEGMAPIQVTEAYMPYSRGMAGFLRLRSHLEDPFGQMNGYQGDLVCSQCHEQEAQSWALTHHAIAYRTLYARNEAENTKCVGCHVTGMDEPGGFVLGDHGSPMSGVGCESCHGPSGPHDGERKDATASCIECHDAEHSVRFDTERAMPHIDHFRANALTPEALQAEMIQLLNGEAERPLLAFPDGPTVGAKECRSCHKTQHKWWKSDVHSQAMATLGEDASRPECVKCHATAKEYRSDIASMGESKNSLDHYRIDESVGCESCHGPGEEHILSPTKANIVGLGESCPECIIEGICKTCHTPKWDMKWDLDTRLKAIAH